MLNRLLPILIGCLVTVSSYAANESNTLPERRAWYEQLSVNRAEVIASIWALQAWQFLAVYTDSSNNLSWSEKLPGTYSNGCVNANNQFDHSKCTFEINPDGSFKRDTQGNRQVKVDDSNAAIACKKIGARLPTKPEFESLIRSFVDEQGKPLYTEDSYGPRLTAKGFAAMKKVFGKMNNWLWSSSVNSNNRDNAYAVSGIYGIIDFGVRGVHLYAVHCVVEGYAL